MALIYFVASTLHIEDVSDAETIPTHVVTFNHFHFPELLLVSTCQYKCHVSALEFILHQYINGKDYDCNITLNICINKKPTHSILIEESNGTKMYATFIH